MIRIIPILLLLVFPTNINAHVRMLDSFPPENSILNEPPEKVTLTFLGSVETVFSKVAVYDFSGNKVSKRETFREDDTVMEVSLDKNLPSGQYTVKWTCMSLDGHKQTGKYTFRVDHRK